MRRNQSVLMLGVVSVLTSRAVGPDHALIDKTNLTKPYDIKLERNVELRAEEEPSDRASLFSAVVETSGELTRRKIPKLKCFPGDI